MNKLEQRLFNDISAFAQQGIVSCAKKNLSKAKVSARIPSFTTEMENKIRLGPESKNHIQVVSSSQQAHRFESEFSGEVPITPLVEDWAEHIRRTKNPRFYLDRHADSLSVDYRDKPYRQGTQKFMFNSIVTEAEVKAELDRVIVNTMRGGTV